MGLDVQSVYTPFYTGPKLVSRNKARDARDTAPPAEHSQQQLPSRAQNKQELAADDVSSRTSCQHKCLDKSSCAHACCKVGVVAKSRKADTWRQTLSNKMQQRQVISML